MPVRRECPELVSLLSLYHTFFCLWDRPYSGRANRHTHCGCRIHRHNHTLTVCTCEWARIHTHKHTMHIIPTGLSSRSEFPAHAGWGMGEGLLWGTCLSSFSRIQDRRERTAYGAIGCGCGARSDIWEWFFFLPTIYLTQYPLFKECEVTLISLVASCPQIWYFLKTNRRGLVRFTIWWYLNNCFLSLGAGETEW